MSIVRDRLPDLYTREFDSVTLQAFGEQSMVSQNSGIFQISNDKTKAYKASSVATLGIWELTGEGEALDEEDPVQMYDKELTHEKYSKKLKTSFESYDDDEYNVLNNIPKAKAMGMGGRARVETLASAVYNNAAGTELSADGQSLCSGAHPQSPEITGTTYANAMTTALSHDALQEMENLINNNMIDGAGLKIEVPSQPILLVPHQLKNQAKRLVSDIAKEQPDTAERNINVFADSYRVVSWRYLTSATAWFIVFPDIAPMFIWRERASYNHWVDNNTENYVWSGRLRCSMGAWDWQGVWMGNT